MLTSNGMKKFLMSVFILSLLTLPILGYAGLVPECVEHIEVVNGQNVEKCEWGFNELLKLINNVITFVLFSLALPIAAIMFAYAGFLMITAGGSSEKVGQAKRIFTNVALGFIIAVIAYLIIAAILSILGFEGDWIGFKI